MRRQVSVCGGSDCTGAGSDGVLAAFAAELERRSLSSHVSLVRTGCRGFCSAGPVVTLYPDGILYCRVAPEDVPEIVERSLLGQAIVPRLVYREPDSHRLLPRYAEIPFFRRQQRNVLRNCGLIDPLNIEEYIATGGYEALAKALTQMSPEEVIAEVKEAGLLGRGGAAFPTGLKWEFARRARGARKHVICNAEEGDPGSFMDRSILEGDPHSVIEGMLIAGYAIGATDGYIYCRTEYPVAVQQLERAVEQCYEYGLLGNRILGTSFSFDIHLRPVPGLYVCGEETALMESISGRRGEPRPRPPMPTTVGLWEHPTVVNNVETLANVPLIISRGAAWYRSIGTEQSKGTKVFAVSGMVNHPGLVEAPWGVTLREVIFEVAGGPPSGYAVKAAHIGGPLGGALPPSYFDEPISHDSFRDAGANVGHGSIVVIGDDTCMVELAQYYVQFGVAESCGKCTPCRVGGRRLQEILARIANGNGSLADLDAIKELAAVMRESSLCALGQMMAAPVLSTIVHFAEDYLAHIQQGRCPAQAKDLPQHSRATRRALAQGSSAAW